MRKIGLVAAAIALMFAAVGSWASLTTSARVESSAGARIDPLQMMADSKNLPVAHYDDYSLVFN